MISYQESDDMARSVMERRFGLLRVQDISRKGEGHGVRRYVFNVQDGLSIKEWQVSVRMKDGKITYFDKPRF